MPTRTRVRKPKTEDTAQEQMPLDAGADTETGETGNENTGEQFYDSKDQQQMDENDINHATVTEGGEHYTFPDGTEGGERDDPSAGNALAGTVAAMTEGQQAAAAELRQFLERMERLGEELKVVRDDMKDVLTEAKGRGYDVAAIRKLLKLRGMDPEKLREQLAVLRTYAGALGIDEELV